MGGTRLQSSTSRFGSGKARAGPGQDPNTEILVTARGTQAIFLAMQTLINPGDEVLIPDPGFVCYEPSAHIAGGLPVSMPLLGKDGFAIDEDTVISHITSRSHMVIVNSPNNPTGGALSHADLMTLSRVAKERDLLVIWSSTAYCSYDVGAPV